MFCVDEYVNFLQENVLQPGYPGKLISAFRFSLRFREVPLGETDFDSLLSKISDSLFFMAGRRRHSTSISVGI